MVEGCDPTYGKVDDLLELLTRSKSLHILLILDRKDGPMRFTDIKKQVDSSSTTVSRRLKELEIHDLVVVTSNEKKSSSKSYTLSKDAKTLGPIMQSLFDWVASREA